MGNRLTEEEQPRQISNTPYGDIFDQCFPHFLVMGMTPEQYWDGEYGLKIAYRKAYRLRVEYDQRMADRNNWYMGQYLIAVLQSVPLLVGGLNVKPSTRLPEYPNQPFLEKYEAEKSEKTRKKQQEDQMKLAMAMFQASITKFNKNLEKRKEREKPADTGQ